MRYGNINEEVEARGEMDRYCGNWKINKHPSLLLPCLACLPGCLLACLLAPSLSFPEREARETFFYPILILPSLELEKI